MPLADTRQAPQRGAVRRSLAKTGRKAARPIDRLEPLPSCLNEWPLGAKRDRRRTAAAALLPRLLEQMEAPPIDAAARDRLLTILYRRGSEAVTSIVRSIVETGPDCANANALREPVISAIYDVMTRRPDWFRKRLPELLEAVDKLPPLMMLVDVMRGLDLFREESLSRYLAMVIENKLIPVLVEPATPREAARQRRQEERALIADARRRRNERAAENNPKLMALYGSRPEILHKASHTALEALASRPLPAAVRAKFERMIIAGERVTGRAVEAAYRAAHPTKRRRSR